MFVNDKRDQILKICGWAPFEDYAMYKIILDEMMNRKTVQYQVRASALALFFVQGVTCKQVFIIFYYKTNKMQLNKFLVFNGIKKTFGI